MEELRSALRRVGLKGKAQIFVHKHLAVQLVGCRKSGGVKKNGKDNVGDLETEVVPVG